MSVRLSGGRRESVCMCMCVCVCEYVCACGYEGVSECMNIFEAILQN